MRDFLYRVEYIALRIVVAFVRMIPLRVLAVVSGMLGWLFFTCAQRRRLEALENLAMVYGDEKSEKELRQIGCRSCASLILTYCEFMHFSRPHARLESFGVFDEDELKKVTEYAARNNGGMYLVAHIGNWEYLSVLGGYVGLELTSIGRAVKNPYLTQYVNAMRCQTGSRMIDKSEAVRGALDVLRNNKCLGTLVDQRAGNSGVPVIFMGHECTATPFPALMKMRFDCMLVPIFCVRRSAGKFFFVIGDEIAVPESMTEKDAIVAYITQAYTNAIEDVVRKYPDQWLWFHRRWRK